MVEQDNAKLFSEWFTRVPFAVHPALTLVLSALSIQRVQNNFILVLICIFLSISEVEYGSDSKCFNN